MFVFFKPFSLSSRELAFSPEAIVPSSTVVNCSVGTFASHTGKTSPADCLACAAGTWAGAGASICVVCSPGSFNLFVGQSSVQACVPCIPGHYCALPHQDPVGCAAGVWVVRVSVQLRVSVGRHFVDRCQAVRIEPAQVGSTVFRPSIPTSHAKPRPVARGQHPTPPP